MQSMRNNHRILFKFLIQMSIAFKRTNKLKSLLHMRQINQKSRLMVTNYIHFYKFMK
jgi:hypothetical protein